MSGTSESPAGWSDSELVRRYGSIRATADPERHRLRRELERRAWANGSVCDGETGVNYEWDPESESVVMRITDPDFRKAREAEIRRRRGLRLGRVVTDGPHRVPGDARQIRDDRTTA